MPHLPTVAIIGRPNTGKSTLFNRLIGKRRAIVSEVPGTTRDRIAHRVETEHVDFLLVDTGGMGGGTQDKDFEANVERQSLLALEHADLTLLTMNSREELTASDQKIVGLLRKRKRQHVPVILVPTKCDTPERIPELLPQYLALGISETVIPVSAPHNIGTEELLTAITKELTILHFKKAARSSQLAARSSPKIAIIGKPNVGKSSLVNALMSDPQRSTSARIVSEIPGTTRDTTDTVIRFQDQDYCFIDTAGIRRRTKREEGIEMFASFRSIQALEECDVALLLLDATEPVSHQDQRIAGMAKEEGKGLIVLLNKIDCVKGEERERKLAEVKRQLDFCRFAPLLPCSATTREGLLKIFPLIAMVCRNRTRRLATSELHQWFRDTVEGHVRGEITKSKHITQAEDIPPTFVLFVKRPKDVRVSDLRYLENSLRRTFGFEGTPIRWITK